MGDQVDESIKGITIYKFNEVSHSVSRPNTHRDTNIIMN